MGKEQNNQRGGWQGFMCLSKNYCRTNSWKWHSQDDNSTSQPSVVQALDHSTRSGLREEAGRVAGSDQQGRIQSPAWKKSQHFSSRHFHHRNNSTKLCPKVIFWFPRGLDDANGSDLIKLLLCQDVPIKELVILWLPPCTGIVRVSFLFKPLNDGLF